MLLIACRGCLCCCLGQIISGTKATCMHSHSHEVAALGGEAGGGVSEGVSK